MTDNEPVATLEKVKAARQSGDTVAATARAESHVVVADRVSKSTARVAVHEFLHRKIARTLFWLLFEFVRRIGGHVGQAYGSDDVSTFLATKREIPLGGVV